MFNTLSNDIHNHYPKYGYYISPLIIIIASFGMYISSYGLRIEHLIIYPLFIVSIIIHVKRKTILNRTCSLYLIVFLWATLFIWFIFVTLLSDDYLSNVRNIMASVDNFIMPIAIILILTAFIENDDEQPLINTICKVSELVCILLSVNAMLVIIHLFFDISFIFDLFLPIKSTSMDSSVWKSSLNMGRYIGIFNSPFESGIVYSIGLMCWIYTQIKNSERKVLNYLKLFLIVIGGILSVSKAFILALPLFLLYILLEIKMNIIRKLFSFQFLLLLLISGVIFKYIISSWSGYNYFMRLFDLNDVNVIYLFSAGRFGESGTSVQNKIAYVLQNAPLHGFGMANKTVVDAAYLEILWMGGIIGLLLYISIFIVNLWQVIKYNKRSQELMFLGVINIYVVMVSFGAPVITKNKFANIYWVLLTLILILVQIQKNNKSKFNIKKFDC